jgi:hypothetical protein
MSLCGEPGSHIMIELRKQVDRYVKGFPFEYDYLTVKLPLNGSAPQLIIEVVDRF